MVIAVGTYFLHVYDVFGIAFRFGKSLHAEIVSPVPADLVHETVFDDDIFADAVFSRFYPDPLRAGRVGHFQIENSRVVTQKVYCAASGPVDRRTPLAVTADIQRLLFGRGEFFEF